MSHYEIDIDNMNICEIENIFQNIPANEFYVGNDINGNLVSFLNFMSVYENNIDDLRGLLKNVISHYNIKYPDPEYTIIKKCIYLTKDNTLDNKTKILKIIIIYVKFMESELYLTHPNTCWDIIGSRIYPWLAINLEHAEKFNSGNLIYHKE